MKANNSRKRKPQRWVIPATLVLVVAATLTAFYVIYTSRKSLANDGYSQMLPMDNTTEALVGGDGSPEYNRTLKAYEQEQAKQAEQSGESRISTVIGKREAALLIEDAAQPEIPEIPKQQPPLVPVIEPKQTPAVAKQQQDKADLDYQKKLEELQASINAAVSKEIAVVNKGMKKDTPAQVSNVFEVDLVSLRPPVAKSSEIYGASAPKVTPFSVGEVLYAVNEIAVNSDVPGPIVAQVIQGPLKGGKFLGSFKRHDEQLLLEFEQFSFNNETIQIEAYAVDPSTAGVAVRSDVDNHYLSRWGGLIGASFLEGFADAVKYSGMETYVQDGAIVQSYPEYSFNNQMWIAAGNVGEKLAVPMLQNFYRPPTVFLDPGIGLGILIISN